MYKIKNFKINLRNRDIVRSVKKLANMPEMTVDVEESVQKACFHFAKFLKPATLYKTFSKDTESLELSTEAPKRHVAQTYYIVTIGDGLEEEFNTNKEAYGEYTQMIVSAIAADAADLAKNFVARLLTKEASEEKCEVSRPEELPKEKYESVCGLLESAKIGVEVVEEAFKPRYTAAGVFYWTPLKKRK